MSAYSGDTLLSSTTTDIDGNFKLKVPCDHAHHLTVKAQYVGYESAEIKNIELAAGSKPVVLELKLVTAILGGLEPSIYYDRGDMDKLDGTKTTITGEEYRRMPH